MRRRLLLLAPCLLPAIPLSATAEPATAQLAMAQPAATQAPAAAPPGLLETVMHRLAEVAHSRATFTETRTIAALAQPVRSSGRLAYRRPDRMEQITVWPRQEVLQVAAGRLTLTEDQGAPQALDLAEHPAIAGLVEAILGTLAGDLAGLRRAYRVRIAGTPAAWRLTLLPREPALAALLRQVTIDGAGASLRRVHSIQANGDESVMHIAPAGSPAG